MSFHGKASLLAAAGAIGQDIVTHECDGDALAVADVHGGAVGAGEGEVVEHERHFILSIHPERPVAAGAAQGVGVLVGHGLGVLDDGHIGTGDSCQSDILGDVARHSHLGCRAVVGHGNVVVGPFLLVDGDAVNVAHCKNFVEDGHRCRIGDRHLSQLRCGESPFHLAGVNPHRLLRLHAQCACHHERKNE